MTVRKESIENLDKNKVHHIHCFPAIHKTHHLVIAGNQVTCNLFLTNQCWLLFNTSLYFRGRILCHFMYPDQLSGSKWHFCHLIMIHDSVTHVVWICKRPHSYWTCAVGNTLARQMYLSVNLERNRRAALPHFSPKSCGVQALSHEFRGLVSRTLSPENC